MVNHARNAFLQLFYYESDAECSILAARDIARIRVLDDNSIDIGYGYWRKQNIYDQIDHGRIIETKLKCQYLPKIAIYYKISESKPQ